jgi:hypothetical protein
MRRTARSVAFAPGPAMKCYELSMKNGDLYARWDAFSVRRTLQAQTIIASAQILPSSVKPHASEKL